VLWWCSIIWLSDHYDIHSTVSSFVWYLVIKLAHRYVAHTCKRMESKGQQLICYTGRIGKNPLGEWWRWWWWWYPVLCSTIWKGHQMRNYWQDTKQREEMNNEKKTEFVKMKGTRLETEYKQMKETERRKRRGREIRWPRPLLLILLSLQLAVVWMMDTWPPSPAAILFRTAFFLAVTNTRSTFGERCLPPCSQLMMGCSRRTIPL